MTGAGSLSLGLDPSRKPLCTLTFVGEAREAGDVARHARPLRRRKKLIVSGSETGADRSPKEL